MKKYLFPLVCFFSIIDSHGQIPFITVHGSKANYSITIPEDYVPKTIVGSNVDLKYANEVGASIVTVVTKAPYGAKESDLQQLANTPNSQLISQLESTGLENIAIINKGLRQINGVTSYFAYYRSKVLYHHVITQLVNGVIVSLTCTCDYQFKDSYLPYINRVANSLEWK
ncbi:MAG: hypothetical protein WCI31_07960 [Prolixibacteraceae bacterium]